MLQNQKKKMQYTYVNICTFFFGGGDVVVYLITSKYRKFKIKKLGKVIVKYVEFLSYQNNILIKH